MNDVIFVVLMWLALGIAFVCGAAWNSSAYTRGFDEGWSAGFNSALGREPK